MGVEIGIAVGDLVATNSEQVLDHESEPGKRPGLRARQGLLQCMGDKGAGRVVSRDGDHGALTCDALRAGGLGQGRSYNSRRPLNARKRQTPVGADERRMRGLPRAVWALGLTSLFMDTSSELIHGLLPLFLVLNLGASAAVLGLVEGIAEATAQISRVFSGWLSDRLGRRKALTVAGYGLAAITKPLFSLAHSVGLVLF